MYDLKDKVALVTGAGGEHGIGRAIAMRLAKEGADVAVNDITANPKKSATWDGLPSLVKEIRGLGRNAKAFEADISNSHQVDQLIKDTIQEFGHIDILVNNAGSAAGPDRVPIIELDEEVWDQVQLINIKGTFLCCRAVAKELIKQGHGGKIINMSSIAGTKGISRFGAYCASKFAVRGLTQSLAKELGEYGIQVNAICPGNFFDGPLWADPEKGLFVQYLNAGKVAGAKTTEDVRRSYEAKVPMGRGCTVEDVVRGILYLVEQRYETGQALPITGGQVMLS